MCEESALCRFVKSRLVFIPNLKWNLLQAIRELVFTQGLTRDEGEFVYRMFDQNTALDLHFAMFLPTILGQGTREQVHRIIACLIAV